MDRDDFFRLGKTNTLCPAQGTVPHPRLIEVVKLLARIAAERDYTEYINAQDKED